MIKSNDNLVIIPAAGLGTRMGMKPNQSKEMLPDPNTGEPIINWSLKVSRKYDRLIIIREGKNDLIDYMRQTYPDVRTLVIPETKSWQDTLLASQELWQRNNLLVLPDTRFKPLCSIDKCFYLLKTYDTVSATHEVPDPENWGIISTGYLFEKPVKNEGNLAWGLLGFTRACGEELMDIRYKMIKATPLFNFRSFELKSFVDLTRTGTLEKY